MRPHWHRFEFIRTIELMKSDGGTVGLDIYACSCGKQQTEIDF